MVRKPRSLVGPMLAATLALGTAQAWAQDAGSSVRARLIVPGVRVGQIALGLEPAVLERRLGPPTYSDAAMGKVWNIWRSKSASVGEGDTLSVYSSRGTDDHVRVRLIRVTSPFFHTAGGLSMRSPWSLIRRRSPHLRRLDLGNSRVKGAIYDDVAGGIAFEIQGPGSKRARCVSITVHERGADANAPYLSRPQ